MQITNNQIIQNSSSSNSNFATQVNSENKTVSFDSYLTAISEVQSVKNTAYSQQTSKVDYSNYTPSQIKEIPYEEAKANYDEIFKRINDIDEQKLSFDEGNVRTNVFFQLSKVKLSDNDKLNKAVYETMRAIKDPIESVTVGDEIRTNLQDYYYGKPINASFVVSNNPIHTDKNLTKSELNSINVEDFLSKMISAFSEDYANTSGVVKQQYKEIVNGYNLFQKNYNTEKEKGDAFASLISSKGTTKENIKDEDLIKSLYDDIISLLKTGFTVGELKAFEEKLKQILKMKQDSKKSINEMEAALKKLAMEIQEAKKHITGLVIEKANNTTSLGNSTSEKEALAKLEMILKMS